MNALQLDFILQELNRFTQFHGIKIGHQNTGPALDALSQFSLKRKNLILYEAIIWCVILLVCLCMLLFFRKKPLTPSSTALYATMIFGSFGLLLRAMYALGRNRKFRMIVKLLQLEYQAVSNE
ncbi:MAG: hypothetical protein V4714_02530 [Bacteroidota bacterium]